jgi:hypothetical protein
VPIFVLSSIAPYAPYLPSGRELILRVEGYVCSSCVSVCQVAVLNFAVVITALLLVVGELRRQNTFRPYFDRMEAQALALAGPVIDRLPPWIAVALGLKARPQPTMVGRRGGGGEREVFYGPGWRGPILFYIFITHDASSLGG